MGKTMIVGFLAQKKEIWMAYVLDTRWQQEHFGTYRELIRTGATDICYRITTLWLAHTRHSQDMFIGFHASQKIENILLFTKNVCLYWSVHQIAMPKPCPTVVSLTWETSRSI